FSLSEAIVKTNYFRLREYFKKKGKPKSDDWKGFVHSQIMNQFYRVFRYKAPLTTSTEAAENILPFHATTASYSTTQENASHTSPIYAVDTKAVIDNEIPEDNKPPLKNAYIPTNCVKILDQKQGIIAFTGYKFAVAEVDAGTRSEGKTGQDYALKDPDISVVIAFFKKFIGESLQDDYYVGGGEDGYEDTGARSKALSNNGETYSVIASDIFYIERDLSGSGTYAELNKDEVDAFSLLYSQDFFNGFITESTRELVLAKLPSNITKLDNALRYVSIETSSSSATTMTLR
ncbi:unnamed protein product, partial [marine sediment metagenome]